MKRAAPHLVLFVLSDASDLQEDEARARLGEALRPFQTPSGKLGPRMPKVLPVAAGHAYVTIAVETEVPNDQDPRATADQLLQTIRRHTAGQVDRTEIVPLDEL